MTMDQLREARLYDYHLIVVDAILSLRDVSREPIAHWLNKRMQDLYHPEYLPHAPPMDWDVHGSIPPDPLLSDSARREQHINRVEDYLAYLKEMK